MSDGFYHAASSHWDSLPRNAKISELQICGILRQMSFTQADACKVQCTDDPSCSHTESGKVLTRSGPCSLTHKKYALIEQ